MVVYVWLVRANLKVKSHARLNVLGYVTFRNNAVSLISIRSNLISIKSGLVWFTTICPTINVSPDVVTLCMFPVALFPFKVQGATLKEYCVAKVKPETV